MHHRARGLLESFDFMRLQLWGSTAGFNCAPPERARFEQDQFIRGVSESPIYSFEINLIIIGEFRANLPIAFELNIDGYSFLRAQTKSPRQCEGLRQASGFYDAVTAAGCSQPACPSGRS
jgi:hypothetical protein